MKRHLVGLNTDIVINFPDNISLDPEDPIVQKICREQFIDFLESSEFITLSLIIDPDEEEFDEEEDMMWIYIDL